MKNVKLALRRAASRLGLHGIIGIVLLLFSLGLYLSSIAPAKRKAVDLQAKVLGLPEQFRSPATSGSAQGPLADFYAFFPPLEAIPECLAKVYALAEREGLDVPKGEYRLAASGERIVGYQAVLPLRGTYSQLRRFVMAVLNELPYASLDDLRLGKQRAEDTVIESRIKLTFYLRSK